MSSFRTRPPVRPIDDDGASFVAGFPCSVGGCPGRLETGEHDGRSAVVCDVCGHCYYVLDG